MNKENQNSEDNLRDEYNLAELKIAQVGKGWARKFAWAICVKSEDKKLIPLKLYKVEIYPQLSKAKIFDEQGKAIFYPQDWFLPVKFAKSINNVLEQVI